MLRAGTQLGLYNSSIDGLLSSPSQSIDRLSFDDYTQLLIDNGRIEAGPEGTLLKDLALNSGVSFADALAGKGGIDLTSDEVQNALAYGKELNEWKRSVSGSNGLYSYGDDLTRGSGYDPELNVWYGGDGMLGEELGNSTYGSQNDFGEDNNFVTFTDRQVATPSTFSAPTGNEDSLTPQERKMREGLDSYLKTSTPSVENDYQRTLEKAERAGIDLGIDSLEDFQALSGDNVDNIRSILELGPLRDRAQYTFDFNEKQHEAAMERERNKGLALAAAATFMTMGVGGAFGAAGGVAAGTPGAGLGLGSAAQGAFTGGAVGATQGDGLEGILKGAALGGLGGAAKDVFTAAGGLEGISDSIGLGDAFDSVSGVVDDFTGAVGDFAGGVADDFTDAVGDVIDAVNPFDEAPTSIDLGNTAFNPLPSADMALDGDFSLISNPGDVFLDNVVDSTAPFNPLPSADMALTGDFGLTPGLGLVTENPSVFNGDTNAPFDPATLGMSDSEIVIDEMFPVVDTSGGRIDEVADNLMAGAVNVADYTDAAIPDMLDVMSGDATINNDGMLGNIEPSSVGQPFDMPFDDPVDQTSLEGQFYGDTEEIFSDVITPSFSPIPLPLDVGAIETGLEWLSGADGEQAQPVGSGVTSAPFVGATGSGFKDNRLKSQLLRSVNPLLLRRGLLG